MLLLIALTLFLRPGFIIPIVRQSTIVSYSRIVSNYTIVNTNTIIAQPYYTVPTSIPVMNQSCCPQSTYSKFRSPSCTICTPSIKANCPTCTLKIRTVTMPKQYTHTHRHKHVPTRTRTHAHTHTHTHKGLGDSEIVHCMIARAQPHKHVKKLTINCPFKFDGCREDYSSTASC